MKARSATLLACPVLLLLASCVVDEIPGYSPNRAQPRTDGLLNTASGTTKLGASRPSTDKFDITDLVRAKNRAILTTGLDSARNPIDATGTVVSNGKIYLHTTWTDLPDHDIQAKTELRDTQGAIVHTAHSTFRPQGGAWVSFAWYTFKDADLPGVWEFAVTLDDTLALKKEFLVREPHGVIRSQQSTNRPVGELIPDGIAPPQTAELPTSLNEIPELEALPPRPNIPARPSAPRTRLPDFGDPSR